MSDMTPPSAANEGPSSNGSSNGASYHASGAGTGSADAGFSGSDENHTSSGAGDDSKPIWQRLLYAVGFAFLAYCTLWVLIVMAIVQFVVIGIDKKPNADLKKFSRNTSQYLFELVAFISFSSDDRPFPFGAFPSVPE